MYIVVSCVSQKLMLQSNVIFMYMLIIMLQKLMESAGHNVLIPFQHVISNAYNAYASGHFI